MFVSSPSFVSINNPCVSRSSLPIGKMRSLVLIRLTTFFLPNSSDAVETMPFGLLIRKYTFFGFDNSWPLIFITDFIGMRCPCSVIFTPFAVIEECLRNASIPRREATPNEESNLSARIVFVFFADSACEF